MKSLKKQAYALFQAVVCQRDVMCQHPGCRDISSAAHHVFRRNNMGTAFLPDNGMGLCLEHHDGWARQYPSQVKVILQRKIGNKRYDELERLANSVVKLKDADLKQIIHSLQEQLNGKQ